MNLLGGTRVGSPHAPTSHRRRKVLSGLVGISLAATLAACGSDGSDSGASAAVGAASGKPETASLSVGFLPLADYLPVFVALKEGYFEAEGLKVTTKQMPPGSPVSPTVGGSFDIGGIPWAGFLVAVSHNVPLVGVAGATAGVPKFASFVVRSESPIQAPKDLSGKPTAVVGVPGNCNIILDGTLQKDGTAPPKYLNVGAAQMQAALDKGDIQAACVPQPILGGLLASGKYRVVFDVFGGENEGLPLLGFSTRKAFADKNPNTLAAFKRAIAKADATIKSNPTIVAEVLPTYTPFKADQITSLVLPTFSADVDRARLEGLAVTLKDLKVVDKAIDIPPFAK